MRGILPWLQTFHRVIKHYGCPVFVVLDQYVAAILNIKLCLKWLELIQLHTVKVAENALEPSIRPKLTQTS